jgi:hypothetical protein
MNVYIMTSVTHIKNSVGILIICYISFHTINLSYFLPYLFPFPSYMLSHDATRLAFNITTYE